MFFSHLSAKPPRAAYTSEYGICGGPLSVFVISQSHWHYSLPLISQYSTSAITSLTFSSSLPLHEPRTLSTLYLTLALSLFSILYLALLHLHPAVHLVMSQTPCLSYPLSFYPLSTLLSISFISPQSSHSNISSLSSLGSLPRSICLLLSHRSPLSASSLSFKIILYIYHLSLSFSLTPYLDLAF